MIVNQQFGFLFNKLEFFCIYFLWKGWGPLRFSQGRLTGDQKKKMSMHCCCWIKWLLAKQCFVKCLDETSLSDMDFRKMHGKTHWGAFYISYGSRCSSLSVFSWEVRMKNKMPQISGQTLEALLIIPLLFFKFQPPHEAKGYFRSLWGSRRRGNAYNGEEREHFLLCPTKLIHARYKMRTIRKCFR